MYPSCNKGPTQHGAQNLLLLDRLFGDAQGPHKNEGFFVGFSTVNRGEVPCGHLSDSG